ncbi:ornithine decarboxylase SpeF [Shewanella glacialipiscicola]|uniref:Ornithine decarboxylase SpeF n=1 Tax=Shewanella glacialipiscicola TaxID=614069 RepID=A0ABQ6J7U4_9GAMM|nr:ornithine decarboxylase SpeF [Shewanella glacialipiscicola]MCL1086425.1 ornithine decarboxylase SpeF [Shewanella glacialipiscicola]MCU7995301.1 ornithine decarboxylase SpeF [Shewanella glacialipiscicola]MCU8026644.1 ornithine decarboxylase SpeF [Shewanella glacialipiscicola]GIU12624.1 ornithine decarboxylase SpeF [Shewanella glacialipiscicola]GMA84218.1 ornithine decarboxylase SpeF [Shewanella glacialipiscicola]
MKSLKVAASLSVRSCFDIDREVVNVLTTDFCDVGAAVVSVDDVRNGIVEKIKNTGLKLPIFVSVCCEETFPDDVCSSITGVFELCGDNTDFYGKQVETAVNKYEQALLPPFFGTLKKYVEMGNSTFACPGHQGGQFFRKHPVGRQFFDFFGETIFRADMCNADVKLGDLLIHEGAPLAAQKYAAKVFNADKTYFVLNGTSSSNKVATNALLAKGDLVLFDRNNHKSNHHGALIQAGATPIYLETARNPFGFIGGIDAHCFQESYLRDQIREVAPERADEKRPFRLAIIQLGTYDGTIYNARQVIDKIGHLCDYVLFDSAWVGYEQFIPMMNECSPLLLELTAEDPGIIVTQSVHKQQAGFSQTSQIHKKDKHIKGQDRYCNHKRFNNAFMMHASTSPFYPLFAALDVNAKMHEGASGRYLWREAVKAGIEARKLLLKKCKYIKPFVPTMIDGRLWQDYETEQMADDLRFFEFEPGQKWHSFEGYEKGQYFVDPCKFLLTTPGIDVETGKYTDFGIPATILANFLRENNIIPEKCDLNSILFLMTPAEDMAKMQHLVSQISRFEKLVDEDAPLSEVLPNVYNANKARYQDYTIRQLCQEMHNLYVSHDVKQLQKEMFRKAHFPIKVMDPQEANLEFIRGKVELVPLSQIEGRIAAEGALPYPPGVLCMVPGEIWGGSVQHYFQALEEGINLLPGFSPELQGVYLENTPDGKIQAMGYVLNK